MGEEGWGWGQQTPSSRSPSLHLRVLEIRINGNGRVCWSQLVYERPAQEVHFLGVGEMGAISPLGPAPPSRGCGEAGG